MSQSDRTPSGMKHRVMWHALDIAEVLQRLSVDPSKGLSAQDAQFRLETAGLNRFSNQAPRSPWLLFFCQFRSILILILIGAAVIAALIGDIKDAIVILAVVFINAIISFYQEYKADSSLAALGGMIPIYAHVLRSGEKTRINAEELVPGDVVLLHAGDRVPADGRLVVAVEFAIDESILTGESQPVDKQGLISLAVDTQVADRLNMAFMNTMVTHGRGEMIVTSTGKHSEMGDITEQMVAIPERPSPLQVQLDTLGKRLGAVAIVLVSILFFMQLFRGVTLTDALLHSIALAVAAIPEGLPIVVTVTLALGMHQMARHRAVIKRLGSVETLGCASVICSDKTGTLTLNQMTVKAFFYRNQRFDVSGEGYNAHGVIQGEDPMSELPDLKHLLLPLVVCNDSHIIDGRVMGDPMEAALLMFVAKAGLNDETLLAENPRIAEIPFDARHKYMATMHQTGNGLTLFVKGAPEVLLEHCDWYLSRDHNEPVDTMFRERVLHEYAVLAARGLRCLLIASRSFGADTSSSVHDLSLSVSHLTFIGLVGLMDPPRSQAKQAIAYCIRAGIAVKMITGDHPDTGMAIAHALGLKGMAVTGEALDRMDVNTLAGMIDKIAIFARVTPLHKVKIVQALQNIGHVVAMSGDGVNDVPALKAADIGIAMGMAGTDVAKDAAGMVLTDDNFTTIVSAVRQGRVLYENIIKFIRFQLSTTMGAILTVFFAPILGLPEPFNPIQMLWIAMIMDGPPAVSLALDAGRAGIMNDPPRHHLEPVLPWLRLGKIGIFGVIMMLGTLAVLHYALQAGEEARALTLGFTTFVLFQFFNIFNARAEKGSSFSGVFFKNKMLWWSLAGVLVLQALAVHWPPAQSIFGTTDLSAFEWLIAMSVASSIVILDEVYKAVVRWFF